VAIYDPQLRPSKAERLAISILDALLRRSTDGERSPNSGNDSLEISPSEARELATFLDEFRQSRKFLDSAYFTEALANGEALANPRAKEIFLSWRTRLGKTRVASTFAWNELVVRSGFGVSESARMYVRTYRSPVQPMELSYFVAMELRLARSYGLSNQAKEIITEFYQRRLRLIADVRGGDRPMRSGAVGQLASDMAETFDGVAKCSPRKGVSKARVAACTSLIMDIGAMFITRDWTAAGVASVVGSTFPDLVGMESSVA
jgi:hypothetical protein